MDKLSNLIQEARPLYQKRKIQKKIAGTILAATFPLFIFGSAYQLYLEGSDIYVSLDNNHIQQELLQDDLGLYR